MTISTETKIQLDRICNHLEIQRLELFGSATGGNFSSNSDLDFLVEFKEAAKSSLFKNYFDLKEQLERLFDRKVDVVMRSAIKNPYFLNSIEKTELLYEG